MYTAWLQQQPAHSIVYLGFATLAGQLTRPFTVTWVVPVYEQTDHGVLLKTMADDPGKLVTSVPQDCFSLKLGTRVRGSYGEGVVIGAQCTPKEVTQYRIEKQDGGRFWAQRDELETL